MAAGETWKQCAEALGMPTTAAHTSLTVLRRQTAGTDLWEEFESVVERLASSLDQTRNRTNFTRRRQALQDWDLPLAHWQSICSDVYQAGPHLGPQDPSIGTVLIWGKATEAEHLHSPTLTMLRHQEGSAARTLNNKIALFRTPVSRTGSNLLVRTRIDTYAQALATRCDLAAEPCLDLAELLPWDTRPRDTEGVEIALLQPSQ